MTASLLLILLLLEDKCGVSRPSCDKPLLMGFIVLKSGEFGIEEVYVPSQIAGKSEVEALNQSEKLVEKYMEYVNKETKIKCEGIVVNGQPEMKVIEGLTNLRADAVVIGTHDRSVLSRTMLCSLTDHLAHNSPCPLLVAKMPKSPAHPETDLESKRVD